MLLHDASRSGTAPGRLPEKLKFVWQTPVAKPTEGPLADAWRASLTSCLTAPAAAGGTVLVAAGRVCDEKSGKVSGFLWLIGREDSKKLAELPLEAPPVYLGLAVAGGRVYVALQDGSVVCLGKAD